jgi:Icc-related predicted phosphoesterase
VAPLRAFRRAKPTKLFFATDLHGSRVCFRKFCEALDFYGCDELILGGDVTGKLLVPIAVHNGRATFDIGGATRTVDTSDLPEHRRRIENMGYYPVVAEPDEIEALEDGEAYERRLLEEAVKRIGEWVEYAEERLGDGGTTIWFAPGNDDEPVIDAAFEGSRVFQNCEGRVVTVGGHEMIATGWANPTPWNTPRECSEAELEVRLRAQVDALSDPGTAIFNFHVPPHGTTLDVCPELDDELRVVTVMGNPVQAHAGSTAVRSVIEEYQPVASLHGHIHESRNAARLGRTFAINPGSEYAEGILLGAIVSVTDDGASYSFTAG